MNAHIDPQIITKDGKPVFAVIPWEEYKKLVKDQARKDESEIWFPNEVVKANVRGESLVKAWREYYGLTQSELAEKAGMKQSALARIEKSGSARTSTLKKLAKALDISVEQLVD